MTVTNRWDSQHRPGEDCIDQKYILLQLFRTFLQRFDVCKHDVVIRFSRVYMCRSRATHWKQTVFYLNDTLIVAPGNKVLVKLDCAPNAKNPRDLDINIEYSLTNNQGSWEGKQEYRLR